MKMLEGLFDHMVLQRNRQGVSEQSLCGTTAARGALVLRVKKDGRTLPGFAQVRAGAAARGRFRGCLNGLPTGGPYDIDLAIVDASGQTIEKLDVKDVLVGDVWMLAGQSNMQGVGLLKDGPKAQPLVRAFYMNDCWRPAQDPIHNMWQAVDQVHADLCGGALPPPVTDWGVAPGVTFGQRMFELTGVPQGLIASAHGGTSMAQWDPKLKHLGGRSLYGAMIRRLRKNGGRVAGFLWYQGCSDTNADAAKVFTLRMKELIRAVRRDFQAPDLPVVMVQIARVIAAWGPDHGIQWNSIQDQQRRLQQIIRRCAVVPAIDLPLDDLIHISGTGQVRLGLRMAQAMQVLRLGRRAGKMPITLKRIRAQKDSRGETELIVEFDNVEGRLQSGSRPWGFAVTGPTSDERIYDVQLRGNCAVVRTNLPAGAVGTYSLVYGRGVNPYCNIVDRADRAVPVFGPVALGQPRALSPFVRTLRVSGFVPCAPGLRGLKRPPTPQALKYQVREFPAEFCDRHAEIAKLAPTENVAFYACRLRCQEKMKLAACLGYDGPVMMWVDGRRVFSDPKGTNPARQDSARVPFVAQRGTHEVVIALGTNRGAAWGIFLRFERTDVSRAQLRKGPAHYAMPEITAG